MSEDEISMLILTANGTPSTQIAAALNIPPSTVRWRLFRLYRKIGARNAAHAVGIAYRAGLIRNEHITLPIKETP